MCKREMPGVQNSSLGLGWGREWRVLILNARIYGGERRAVLLAGNAFSSGFRFLAIACARRGRRGDLFRWLQDWSAAYNDIRIVGVNFPNLHFICIVII